MKNEEIRRNTEEYDEKQMDDAKRFCQILESVPKTQRDTFLAVANAYMDGMVAGSTIVSMTPQSKNPEETNE